jgi:O-acetylserine/cysteine efflux transporter
MTVQTGGPTGMSRRHQALAVLVALIWGSNFVVIDGGLRSVPPLLFAALRFALVAVPAVFFIPRPKVRWYWIVIVGLFMGVGQFGLLFVGMSLGAPAGLSSLVLQSQAVFTVVFAAVVLREIPRRRQLIGLAAAVAGLGLIIAVQPHASSLFPLLLVVAAGACWGASNIGIRLAKPDDGLRLLVWSSLVSPIPLAVLSLAIEGPSADLDAFRDANLTSVGSLLFTVVLSTLVAFGLWFMLIRQYAASTVAPFSLLVPPIGILTAWVVLLEKPRPPELAGVALVLAGLAVMNVPPSTLGRWWRALLRRGGDESAAPTGPVPAEVTPLDRSR